MSHRTHISTMALIVTLTLGASACQPGESDAPAEPPASSPDGHETVEHAVEGVRTAHFTVVSTSPTQSFTITGEIDRTQDEQAVASALVSSDDSTNVDRVISVDGHLWREADEYGDDLWYLLPDHPPLWDPLRDLPGLLGAASEVDRVGVTVIDGATVDHFSMVVDSELLPAELLATGPIPADGAKYELYIDEGLLVGYDNDMDGSTIKSRLTDINEPVVIESPPPERQLSPELTRLLLGSE